MGWREWFKKRRVKNELQVLQRRGQWDDVPEALEWLLGYVRKATFTKYSVAVAEKLSLTTLTPNVDELVQRVLRACWVLSQRENVDRYSETAPVTQTLDQYLISNNELPIRPEEVVKVLTPPLTEFLQELQLLHSEEDVRSNYYRRHYAQTLGDLRSLLISLLRASDDALLND